MNLKELLFMAKPMSHDNLWDELKAAESRQRDAARRVNWLERRLQESSTQAEYVERLEELHKAEAEAERVAYACMNVRYAWADATNPFTRK